MKDQILILYGTVTGNVEICAIKAARHLDAAGFNSVVKDIFDVAADELQNEHTLLICISTYGEGDPPDSAAPMWEALVRAGDFDLSGLRFSVLGLGDSSYSKFCQCGKDFDAALERHGAKRIAPRVDSDVEYEKFCATWIESVVAVLKAEVAKPATALCTK